MATNHGAIATFTDATTYDIANILLTLAQSVEPGVVGYYANNTARDAGTLALRNAGVKGFKAFVLSPPAGDSLAAGDWCGWNGTEWIWEHPAPVTYESANFAGTGVISSTYSGHIPSLFTFTPTRSGLATVRMLVSAQSAISGYGTGYVRPRYSSGTLFPGGRVWSVLDEHPAGFRQDTQQEYYIPIYLTKGVAVQLAIDVASFTGSGPAWQLNGGQWLITQY
jgi:hypothetical protein